MRQPNRTVASSPQTQRAADAALTISRRRVRHCLTFTIVLLLVGSAVVKSINIAWGNDHIFGLLDLLWVDEEGNLPSWFSSTLILASAVVAFLISTARRDRQLSHRGWFVLSALLLLLAIDEAAAIHEISTTYAVRANGLGLFPRRSSYAWVVFALPLVIAGSWYAARALRRIEAPVRDRLGVGLPVWMSGVFGIEALTGQLIGYQPDTWAYLYLATAEEGAEMLGALIFLDGLLLHLANHPVGLALRVVNDEA